MANLQQLRQSAFKGEDIETLMALDAFAHTLRTAYERKNVPEPDWLGTRITELSREIAMRNSDSIQKRIRELKAQQQALMTPGEKKKSIEAELAELQAQL